MIEQLSPEAIAAGIIGILSLANWWRLNRRLRRAIKREEYESSCNEKIIENLRVNFRVELDAQKKDKDYYYNKYQDLSKKVSEELNEKERIRLQQEEKVRQQEREEDHKKTYQLWEIKFNCLPIAKAQIKLVMNIQNKSTRLDTYNFEEVIDTPSYLNKPSLIQSGMNTLLDRLVEHTKMMEHVAALSFEKKHGED